MNISSEISAIEAWTLLNSNINYTLVDVRTNEEMASCGSPKLANKVIRIPSHTGSLMLENLDFIKELENSAQDKNQNLIFICRSNGRSQIAKLAAEKAGYKNCYIVIDGYIGSENGVGWLNSKLPFEIVKA